MEPETMDPIMRAALERGLPLKWGYRNVVGPAITREQKERERLRIKLKEDRIVEAITVETLELTDHGEFVIDMIDHLDFIRERALAKRMNILQYLVSLLPVTWQGPLNHETVLIWDEEGVWQFKLDVREWRQRWVLVTCLGRRPTPGESMRIKHQKRPKHHVG